MSLSASGEWEELLALGEHSPSQWRGYCQKDSPETWTASDGVLHFSPGSAGTRGDLITREQFGDFELSLEWKIAEGGNSGIFYRASEACADASGAATPIYQSAPEMQILDNERHPDAQAGKGGNRQAGALYDLIAAEPQNARPAGEWNEASISVVDSQVRHIQNGQVVVQYALGTEEWRARIKDSKFSAWPPFADTPARGHIGLQDHGNEVWFRHIRLRRR